MISQYLDFVPNSTLKDKNYLENDILVYTKKTKKRLLAGFIRNIPQVFGESKFYPKDNIFFGKHCLLALSRFMNKLDKGQINYEKED